MFAPRRALSVMLVSLPALALMGCPKKHKVVDEDTGQSTPVQSAEAALNLSSIDPSSVAPGATFDAMLYGAGFDESARVTIGGQDALSVRIQSSRVMEIQGPALAAGRYDVTVTQGEERSSLRQGLRVEDDSSECRNLVLYFDLDADTLRADSLDILNDNLACLSRATAPLTIEGNCDERGTTEYNIALGQRRADTVRDWLSRQGVRGDRMRTVSFGEERPADPGHNESAWARNRRAELHLGR